MSEWWTYSLADFLMFSAQTYWRMFELHHRAWWPLHFAGVALAVFAVLHCRRPTMLWQRWLLTGFAVAWAFLAWAFFANRFAEIHLAGQTLAAAAALQASLLLAVALLGKSQRPDNASAFGAAFALVLYAVVLYPVLGACLDRSWRQIEWLGMTPDATALATLAVVAASRHRWRWLAVPIPLLCLLFSATTLYALQQREIWVLLVGVVFAIVTLMPVRAGRRSET